VLLLRIGSEARDHRRANGRGYEQQEKWTSGGGELLADDGELVDPQAATAVLLGRVDADEALLRDLLPELVGRKPFSCLLGVVLAPVLPPDLANLLSKHLLLFGFHKRHGAVVPRRANTVSMSMSDRW